MARRAHAPVLPNRGPPGRPPLRSPAALPGLPVAVLGAGALRRGQALVAAAQRRVADAAAQACRTPRDASSCQHALISGCQSTSSLWLGSGTRLAHQSTTDRRAAHSVQQRADAAAHEGVPLQNQHQRHSAVQAIRMRLHLRSLKTRSAKGPPAPRKALESPSWNARSSSVLKTSGEPPPCGRVRGTWSGAFSSPPPSHNIADKQRSAGHATLERSTSVPAAAPVDGSFPPTRARSCSQSGQPPAAAQDPGGPGACLRGCRQRPQRRCERGGAAGGRARRRVPARVRPGRASALRSCAGRRTLPVVRPALRSPCSPTCGSSVPRSPRAVPAVPPRGPHASSQSGL